MKAIYKSRYLLRAISSIAVLYLLVMTHGCYMNSTKISSIWTAIDRDDESAIKSIAKQGQELNAVGLFTRKTPLEYALENRKKEAFRALLECGADPDFFLLSKQTVTFYCALLDDSYWLKQVLAHGADPNLWTRTHHNNSATPLAATFYFSSESPQSVENAKLLIDAGADLNLTIVRNQNPLSVFAMYGGWKVVLYLLEKGADPHIGPQANVFVTHLQKPSDHLSKDPDFRAVADKLEEMNLDIANAKWNGKTWDIPKLRP